MAQDFLFVALDRLILFIALDFPTLQAVVKFYDEGGRPNPTIDPEIRPLKLSTDEKRQLVAFLGSLSGKVREGL